MSIILDDVIMEDSHHNTDETLELQPTTSQTPIHEQKIRTLETARELQEELHLAKQAGMSKDKQITDLKSQLRHSRDSVERDVKAHRDATHTHFQTVKSHLEKHIDDLLAEIQRLKRELTDTHLECEQKGHQILLLSEECGKCIEKEFDFKKVIQIQDSTIWRQSNQLMQRGLECESKEKKILQLNSENGEHSEKEAELMRKVQNQAEIISKQSGDSITVIRESGGSNSDYKRLQHRYNGKENELQNAHEEMFELRGRTAAKRKFEE